MSGRSVTWRVARTQSLEMIRGRWFLAYATFFLLVTEALCRFGDGGTRALLTVMDVVLLVVPLVGIVCGTMSFYHAREFTELLLAQPVRRRSVFGGLFAGVILPLAAACALGIGIPFLLRGLPDAAEAGTLAAVVLVGCALTLVFVAMGMLIALRAEDRLRGLGAALGVWLLLAVVYDGLVLLTASALADYPIERPMLGFILVNPIDLGRVLLLLRFDIAALLGYTGAVFQQFFSGLGGIAVAAAALLVWIAVPLGFAARSFARKDF